MERLEALTGPGWTSWAAALLHFLWQGLAVWVLAWLILQTLPARAARARYVISLVSFSVLLALPAVTLFVIRQGASPPHASQVQTSPRPSVARSAAPIPAPPLIVVEHGDAPSFDFNEAADSTPVMAAAESAEQRHSEPLPVWQPWVLIIWLAGVALLGLRLCLGFGTLLFLTRDRVAVPDSLTRRCTLLARASGLRCAPRVAVSRRVSQAIVVGYFRPIILLPLTWASQLPPDVLDAVLSHELAHIRRWDLWVILVQRVAETLLFFHPGVWWMSRQLSRERELCCDALAVSVTGSAARYAAALEHVASRHWPARTPLLTSALGGTKKMELLRRIHHILGISEPRRGPRVASAVALLSAITVVACVARGGPAEEEPTQQQARPARRQPQPSPAPRVHALVDQWPAPQAHFVLDPADPQVTIEFGLADSASDPARRLSEKEVEAIRQARAAGLDVMLLLPGPPAIGAVGMETDVAGVRISDKQLVWKLQSGGHSMTDEELVEWRRQRLIHLETSLGALQTMSHPLSVELSFARERELALLSEVPSIRELKLMLPADVGNGINTLTQLQRLRKLAISTSTVDPELVEFSTTRNERCPEWVTRDAVDESALSGLPNIESLRELELDGFAMTQAGLAAVTSIPQLQVFRARMCSLPDTACQNLASRRSLQAIVLQTSPPVSHDGLAALCELPELSTLDVTGMLFNDYDLALLANRPALQRVTLRNGHFTGRGLKRLRQLSLPEITLTDVEIRDLSFAGFRDARLRAKSLVINGAAHTEGEIVRLDEGEISGLAREWINNGSGTKQTSESPTRLEFQHWTPRSGFQTRTFYSTDEVQYFPPGPEFQLSRERPNTQPARVPSLNQPAPQPVPGPDRADSEDPCAEALTDRQRELVASIRQAGGVVQVLCTMKQWLDMSTGEPEIRVETDPTIHVTLRERRAAEKTALTPAIMQALKQLKHPVRLFLHGGNTTRQDLARIAELPSVFAVAVSRESLGDDDIAVLTRAAQLREVQWFGACSDAGLRQLAKLRALRMLHLQTSTPVSAEGMSILAGMGELKNLYVYAGRMEPAALDRLVGMKQLRVLGLFADLSPAQLTKLRHLTALRELEFSRTSPYRQPARVRHALSEDTLYAVLGLPQLKQLRLRNAVLSRVRLERLAQAQHLSSIQIYNCRIEEADEALTAPQMVMLRPALPQLPQVQSSPQPNPRTGALQLSITPMPRPGKPRAAKGAPPAVDAAATGFTTPAATLEAARRAHRRMDWYAYAGCLTRDYQTDLAVQHGILAEVFGAMSLAGESARFHTQLAEFERWSEAEHQRAEALRVHGRPPEQLTAAQRDQLHKPGKLLGITGSEELVETAIDGSATPAERRVARVALLRTNPINRRQLVTHTLHLMLSLHSRDAPPDRPDMGSLVELREDGDTAVGTVECQTSTGLRRVPVRFLRVDGEWKIDHYGTDDVTDSLRALQIGAGALQGRTSPHSSRHPLALDLAPVGVSPEAQLFSFYMGTTY